MVTDKLYEFVKLQKKSSMFWQPLFPSLEQFPLFGRFHARWTNCHRYEESCSDASF